jgi:hypothetical protein
LSFFTEHVLEPAAMPGSSEARHPSLSLEAVYVRDAMSIGSWKTGYNQINGFGQYFREWKPASANSLPMLALHGSLTQSGMLIELVEAAGSIPMTCPDQRGFGLSEDLGTDACAEFASEKLLPSRYVVLGAFILHVRSRSKPLGWLPGRPSLSFLWTQWCTWETLLRLQKRPWLLRLNRSKLLGRASFVRLQPHRSARLVVRAASRRGRKPCRSASTCCAAVNSI